MFGKRLLIGDAMAGPMVKGSEEYVQDAGDLRGCACTLAMLVRNHHSYMHVGSWEVVICTERMMQKRRMKRWHLPYVRGHPGNRATPHWQPTALVAVGLWL